MTSVFDKTGRQIRVGDVLKVFHFQGRRWRKKYYMYKQVLAKVWLGTNPSKPYLKVGHLAMNDDDYYHIALDCARLHDYEIVQGAGDDYHDRVKFIFNEATP